MSPVESVTLVMTLEPVIEQAESSHHFEPTTIRSPALVPLSVTACDTPLPPAELACTSWIAACVTVTGADPDLVESSVEVAVQVDVPAPVGVRATELPEPEIVPFVAVQVTEELKLPVPWTVAVQVAVCAVVMLVGFAETVTEVIVGGAGFTITVTEDGALVPPGPEQVAVYVSVPVAVGVSATVPFVGTDPERLPLPLQDVALVEEMVSVTD